MKRTNIIALIVFIIVIGAAALSAKADDDTCDTIPPTPPYGAFE